MDIPSFQISLQQIISQVHNGQWKNQEDALSQKVQALFNDSNKDIYVAPQIRSEIVHLTEELSHMDTQSKEVIDSVTQVLQKVLQPTHQVLPPSHFAPKQVSEAGMSVEESLSQAQKELATVSHVKEKVAEEHSKTRQLDAEFHHTGTNLFDRIAYLEKTHQDDPQALVGHLNTLLQELEDRKTQTADSVAWAQKELAYDESWAFGALLRRTGMFNQRNDQEFQKLIQTKMDKNALDQEMKALHAKISDWKNIQKLVGTQEKLEIKIAQFKEAAKHLATWDTIEITNYLNDATRHASAEKTAHVNANAVLAKSKARELFNIPLKGSEKSKEFNVILGHKTIELHAGRCFAAAAAVALTLVQDPDITAHVEIAGTMEFNHAFVVVGRANYDPSKPDKGINDLANWGPEAFVIDVWQANQKTGFLEHPLIYDPQSWFYAVSSVKPDKKYPQGALVSTQMWKAEERMQDREHAHEVLKRLQEDQG